MEFNVFNSERKIRLLFIFIISICFVYAGDSGKGLRINEKEYFERPGLNVFVFQNDYTDGHQGGVEIIQNGNRVASCGNLRLSVSPGQWQPLPKLGQSEDGDEFARHNIDSRKVDESENEISLKCSYPYKSRDERGFNPIIYPDLDLDYNVRVKALEGSAFKIIVDLEKPLPDKWVGKVGFNLELFPGNLYGKHFYMDGKSGIFPRQPNGPGYENKKGDINPEPLAKGQELIVAPSSEKYRMKIENKVNELELLDGAFKHANGWFVVRSLVEEDATENAIEWVIKPNVKEDWQYDPIIHVSQVGYHIDQEKTAIIEMDQRIGEENLKKAQLKKIKNDGKKEVVKEAKPEFWGDYLRYNYAKFDFSDVKESGLYEISYGDTTTSTFSIDRDIYDRHVWQPTLETFLPEQMCHMRVNQKYRVWHGECHMDDALMAPNNIEHFDGYNNQKEDSTLSSYEPLEHVPGLNKGGWHDAADYDLRVETQSDIIRILALAYEEFDIQYDQTMIDQRKKLVEIHNPDGQADLLQQVEHGVLSLLGSYKSLGELYRGIIVPTLRQYVHLGEPAVHTDNEIFDNAALKDSIDDLDGLWYKKVANKYSKIMEPDYHYDKQEEYAPNLDDRLVFTEENSAHKLQGVAALAAASRVLKGYNDKLARECIDAAEEIWQKHTKVEGNYAQAMQVNALTELILATNDKQYKEHLASLQKFIKQNISWVGWNIGRISSQLNNDFIENLEPSLKEYSQELDKKLQESPFKVNHNNFMDIGFPVYYLNKHWPKYFDKEALVASVDYFHGVHPGSKTMSLVSGVGSDSPVVAYGPNRADWSYVAGGNVWMNIIEPDFPESKKWPYIWQEREYFTSAPVKYMFTVLAVKKVLSEN